MSFYVVRHGRAVVDTYIVEAENAEDAVAHYEDGHHIYRFEPGGGEMTLIKAGPFRTEHEAIEADIRGYKED